MATGNHSFVRDDVLSTRGREVAVNLCPRPFGRASSAATGRVPLLSLDSISLPVGSWIQRIMAVLLGNKGGNRG